MAHPPCLRFIIHHPNPPSHNARRAHTMRAPLPLSLKRIHPFNTIKLNRSRARTLCFNNSMGDQGGGGASTTETRPVEAAEKKEEAKAGREKSGVPPPPEKPEPGDCCGSGCVRCVWDVYYDELEEYNKLYKSIACGPSTFSVNYMSNLMLLNSIFEMMGAQTQSVLLDVVGRSTVPQVFVMASI